MNADHEDTNTVSHSIRNPSIVIEQDGTYSAVAWTTKGSIRSDRAWSREKAKLSLQEKMLASGAELNAELK